MWRIFSTLVDAVIPPPKDVIVSRSLSEADISALVEPRQAGAPYVHALLPYREPKVRALVRSIKYYGDTRMIPMVGRILGEYAAELIAEKRLLSGWEEIMVIPVPSSKKRFRERGYNQAERIAAAMLPYIGEEVVFAPRALARENRESQVRVERTQREENIRNAFFVPDKENTRNKSILLIDDVAESGATLADARRALMEGGAADVVAIALAH